MISAIVLAAGQSKRMGQPKLLLPWEGTTVIGKVVSTLLQAEIDEIYVVYGANSNELREALNDFPVQYVFNPEYENSEMILSVQLGLQSIKNNSNLALIVLGDQPHIEVQTVRMLIECYVRTKSKIIVPSYQHHRGHPWLVERTLWNDIYNLLPTDTLRDFLKQNQAEIYYVNVDSDNIMKDLDTPEDYTSSHR